MQEITLPSIPDHPEIFEEIEKKIKELFLTEIYLPLIHELTPDKKALQNTLDDLIWAIQRGQISFYRGEFQGVFNAQISRELKKLGAKWDRKNSSWKILANELPIEVKDAIAASEAHFQKVAKRIDQRIEKILPEEIADKLKVQKIFDAGLWKVDKSIKKSIKRITISPELPKESRQKIAEEYTKDLKRYIIDWTKSETKKLRKEVRSHVMSGFRYENLAKSIQDSYGVSQNKAKFLARQESKLMMSKFTETRYLDAGIKEYKWESVAGSPKHPVRPQHKKLNDMSIAGKTFRWDDPPITTEPGKTIRRNNPGEDFGCRCKARPVVRFK